LVGHVENVESWEPDVGVVGSRVGESLLRYSVMTREKRACRVAELGQMSRFRRSLERCRKAVKNAFLLNDFNKIYKK